MPHAVIAADEAAAAHLILRVISFAQTVGLVRADAEAGADLETTFPLAMAGLARAGVAQHANQLVHMHMSAAQMHRTAAAAIAAIEDSPIPSLEWRPMTELLGDDVGRLVGVSASSLARYRSGERDTPDAVAARLHFLTQIVSDLAGSYNDFGIRRWFARKRVALGGRAPSDILTGEWDPDGADVQSVRTLSQSLLGAAIG